MSLPDWFWKIGKTFLKGYFIAISAGLCLFRSFDVCIDDACCFLSACMGISLGLWGMCGIFALFTGQVQILLLMVAFTFAACEYGFLFIFITCLLSGRGDPDCGPNLREWFDTHRYGHQDENGNYI